MRITAFLLSAIAVLPSAFAANVQVLTPANFDDIVLKSGKPALVEFFAPWCGHCKNLAPVYEELATAFTYATDKVSIASVDADEHKSLGNRFGIKGFPTLKWFDGVSETPVDYTGGRDLESLSKWITEKTGLKLKKAKEPVSHINFMNDKTFKKEVGGDKSVFVAFTTAWCGRKWSRNTYLKLNANNTNRLQEACTYMGEACLHLLRR
jgi:protein disulfide-isomerase A6